MNELIDRLEELSQRTSHPPTMGELLPLLIAILKALDGRGIAVGATEPQSLSQDQQTEPPMGESR